MQGGTPLRSGTAAIGKGRKKGCAELIKKHEQKHNRGYEKAGVGRWVVSRPNTNVQGELMLSGGTGTATAGDKTGHKSRAIKKD